ncbi:hypothetical protein DFR58_11256 [Anaerobacterium chartisolvens]|uniref:Flagellar Assembly Protein A N-terminal region domain-containing protein n=1 Tax=Anaerobacterium chartisolvens TaxID=1297424 RepID=A0A369B8T0_9FIRM|nr:FapA family protein [Anaerobacterium chartisolvens]RCX16074.1 hypothetical protein DFR58_11256 [Anaerobacterium chartisolvens]
MRHDIIFSSDYILITKRQDDFYIESFKRGMSVEDFNRLVLEHNNIKIISFIAVKNALLFAPKPPVKFGELRERVAVEISSDELKAYITLCVKEDELQNEKRINLIREIVGKLGENGVIFGVKHDVLLNRLENGKKILIAEGVAPENGDDSVIKMYEMKEPKPEVKEDGNVDHYELNLINKVHVGDWLGERRDPTPGTSGKSVKGNTLLAMEGKKYPLFYDKKTVKEVYENNVSTLYALVDGAVNYSGNRIGVSNHLEIIGNVGFKTGNIDFDGFLTIKGSIEDNFSVTANRDVEILGDYGVGSVREIISREGSVFIKGGIVGKNKAVVKSKKDIYTKYISDATIICDGSVHIGFYCLNSNIIAKEVILDSPKGQIIGGSIEAEIKVISSIIGSQSEKRTSICVKGFDRNNLKDKLENVIRDIEISKSCLSRYKQEMSIYSSSSNLTKEQSVMWDNLREKYNSERDKLKLLEDEKKVFINYLKTHGEGEICILKKAYPGTVIEINRIPKELSKVTLSTCFYVHNGVLKEL